MKYPSRSLFQGYSESTWGRYANWLLGEDVAGLSIQIPGSSIAHSASWATLLDFDFQLRKDMSKKVNEGMAIGDALTAAMQHARTFNRYFEMPTCMEAGAAAAPQQIANSSGNQVRGTKREWQQTVSISSSSTPPNQLDQSAVKGKGKGKKGKGKKGESKGKVKGQETKGIGKGAGSWKAGMSNITPDGKLKCFAFQRGRCAGNCNMAHACQVCNGPHGLKDCPRKPGDATGSRASGN